MPRRRTEDVVHVVMTDHRIGVYPGDPEELVAPREEREPVVTGLHFLRPAHAPEGALGEVYRAVAALRTGAGGAAALEHLSSHLARARPSESEPWLELAQGYLTAHRFAQAEAVLRGVIERDPGNLLAREWLAIARSGQGRRDDAIRILRQLLADDPDRPEAQFNLGRLLLAEGEDRAERDEAVAATEALEEAAGHLRRALELRPNQVAAWDFLGAAHLAMGRPAEAADALRRALALDPTRGDAYLRLAEALVALDRRPEALRYLRHGTQVARDPDPIREAFETLRQGGEGPAARPGPTER